jgi:hypothetical protein
MHALVLCDYSRAGRFQKLRRAGRFGLFFGEKVIPSFGLERSSFL